MFIQTFFNWLKAKFTHTIEVETASPDANTLHTITTAVPAEIAETDLQKAIGIVNNIKAAVASPVAVLITSLIPGTVDDEIREILVNELPVIAAGLANIQGLLNTADKSAQLNDVLNKIRLSPNIDLDAFYHSLAARVLSKITKGGVVWSVAVMSVEYFFKHLFGEEPAAPVVAATEPTEPAAV